MSILSYEYVLVKCFISLGQEGEFQKIDTLSLQDKRLLRLSPQMREDRKGKEVMKISLTEKQLEYLKRSIDSDIRSIEMWLEYVAINKTQMEVSDHKKKLKFLQEFKENIEK